MSLKRALLSVSDKEGLGEFAGQLCQLGWQLLSTGGGTAALLKQEGLPFTLVEDLTGFPEMLDGRVKTLHPAIHGGILARRDCAQHLQQLRQHQIDPIDMVVVNFYPFERAMAEGAPWDTLIENIDIGGPAMVRSAAKNHQSVLVLVEPADYAEVARQLREDGQVDQATRRRLALKAYARTAYYDALISGHLSAQLGEEEGKAEEVDFPARLALPLQLQQRLRYGENPHQQAALYRRPLSRGGNHLLDCKVLQGKPLSYNNIQDADAALQLVRQLPSPAVVALKHANPCGVGQGHDLRQAWQRAYDCDPVSIFGGIIALNAPLSAVVAREIEQIFVEVVLAPAFEEQALAILQHKKNIRLLQVAMKVQPAGEKLVSVDGGMLWWKDQTTAVPAWSQVTGTALDADCLADLRLAWQVVAQVKSNAIVLVRDGGTVGIGAGQMNRVGAARIALSQAGEKARGAVLASDAFFPFADTVELAAAAGVRAIVQPGGSIRDQDSEAVCQRHGMAMFYTGRREFVH